VQTAAISRTIPTHHTAISIASGEMVGCWLQPLKVVRAPDRETGDARLNGGNAEASAKALRSL
jgi:hypothetical protein